jgi:hypothetical protein
VFFGDSPKKPDSAPILSSLLLLGYSDLPDITVPETALP